MSCDAGFETAGCYEAGKLYLQNRELRNYPRAYDRFKRVCESDYPGQGPYACKYLGWMHHTGIGATRDDERAFGYLARACFEHNDVFMIDGEGCHFLAESAQRSRRLTAEPGRLAQYVAFLSLAMGCTDRAKSVCEEASALFTSESRRSAAWINKCDKIVSGPANRCEDLVQPEMQFEQQEPLRRTLTSLFRGAINSAS